MTALLIAALILSIAFAAMCNAVMDTLVHHWEDSIFNNPDAYDEQFWNPQLSDLNKYKNRDPEQGEKFWGSTTFFVWTTDAWHRFQFYMLSGIGSALICAMGIGQTPWWGYVTMFVGFRVLWGLVFELFYKYLLIKKSER